MGNIKQDTIRGVKWSAVERLSVQGVTFVVGLVMARILTPSDFGLIGMLSIFLAVSQTIIDSGFSNALIRKVDRTEIDCSTAFYFNVVIGLVCYGVLYFSSPAIARFYNMPILTDVTRILALTLFLNSLTVVHVAILTIKLDFRSQAKVNLVSSISSGLIGIYLAYSGWGVWSLVYQQILRSIFNVCLYWIVVRWLPMKAFSWASFRNLFSFGSKLLLSGLLHTFYLNVTNLIIGKLYSSKDLGFYERGQQFGKIPLETTINIFQRVTFPILSTIQDDNEKLISVYRKYIKVASIIVFWGMFLFMLSHVTRINLNLLQVKGRSDLFLKLEIIKKTISIVILLIAAPFGIISICCSQILYSFIAVYINTYYTDKLFGLSLWMQIKDFSIYLFSAAMACLPVFVATIFGINNYFCVVFGPIISLLLYSQVLLRKDPVFVEVRDVALGFIRNKK